jgi:hypothetical protein
MAQLENFRFKVFRAVAEQLNFRKAAEHLFAGVSAFGHGKTLGEEYKRWKRPNLKARNGVW